jgi:transcriptional regulator with XRE-family HTH domain
MGRKRKPSEWEKGMAENLKRLRQRAGLSQPQLAKAAGVPLGTLRCWEQATRQPLLGAAVKLADALGVTLDELAGRTPLATRKKGGK